MRKVAKCLVVCVPMMVAAPEGRADQFELLDGPALARTLKSPEVAARPSLSVGDLGAMPNMLRDSRSALVLARTDQGHPARMLLVPELRRPPGAEGEPTPVLVVERLDAFDSGDLSTRLASRRDVLLFDGMPIDLDTGQVVPPGQGGDLVFRTNNGEPRLEPIAPARLFTLNKPPTFDEAAAPRPSPGRAILPGDFNGRYRLFANGQWSGTLDLNVGPKGVVNGRFRSDLHGTAYAATGQVVAEAPGKVRFSVALPRARQEFDGYLFGEGKGAMAGTLTLLDRTFGFFAIREGGRYAPDSRDLGPLQTLDQDRPGRITVELLADGSILLEGKPVPLEKLPEALQPMAESGTDAMPWVLIQAVQDTKLATLNPVVEAIRSAKISTIRFEPLQKSDTKR